MVTVLQAVRERALREFDELVAQRAAESRSSMIAAGCPRDEVEAHIAACLENMAAERAEVPALVVVALLKHQIPLEEPADDWT